MPGGISKREIARNSEKYRERERNNERAASGWRDLARNNENRNDVHVRLVLVAMNRVNFLLNLSCFLLVSVPLAHYLLLRVEEKLSETRMPKATPALPGSHWKLSLVAFLLMLAPAVPQTNDTPQILFLHLKVKGETISLQEATLVAGTLKPQREIQAGLEYELLSKTGHSLWKGTVHDPRVRRLEYEDPPGSGVLKAKIIRSDEAEFSLRVPVVSAADHLEFHSVEPGTNAQPFLVRKSLGRISLPPKPN